VTLRIRPEEPGDVPAVQAIIGAAFPDVDGVVVEVGLNDELRRDHAWIPGLSLVAELDGRVVGQVTSSRGVLAGPTGDRPDRQPVGVGPVSVLPSEQRAGVGRALMTDLIARATRAGEPALVLLGDPAFYRRFGFRPAADAGIRPPDPGWEVHFQALVLRDVHPPLSGRFSYAAPFGRL